LNSNQKLSIDVIAPNGKPLEPNQHATKFINQCGVIVRDTIPITVQEWNEPKKAHVGASFVKKDPKKTFGKSSWQISFYLRSTPNSMMMVMKFRVDVKGEEQSKSSLFRRWLKHSGTTENVIRKFCCEKKTPVFEGAEEKLREQWPEFVAFKDSKRAKEMSLKNKANAEKKTYHHVLGSGRYRTAVPKWEAMEGELRTKGITLGTKGWPKRPKHWWYRHGGLLDPTIGECVHRKLTFTPTVALIKAMDDAASGLIRVD
jgi:hypothetical protein